MQTALLSYYSDAASINGMKRPRKLMQTIPVYLAEHFKVIHGANQGDAISFADDLLLDDVYALGPVAPRFRLSVELDDGGLKIADNGDVGTVGHRLFLDSLVTLMSRDGTTLEAVILVEVGADGHSEHVYLLPFSSILPKMEYTLVGIDRDSAEERFAQIACVSFVKGTRITISTGELKPIEDLKVGDRVITRDRGIQEIRWIGHSTIRATN